MEDDHVSADPRTETGLASGRSTSNTRRSPCALDRSGMTRVASTHGCEFCKETLRRARNRSNWDAS